MHSQFIMCIMFSVYKEEIENVIECSVSLKDFRLRHVIEAEYRIVIFQCYRISWDFIGFHCLNGEQVITIQRHNGQY